MTSSSDDDIISILNQYMMMRKHKMSYEATKYIMTKLDEIFVDMDAEVLEASKKWGVERYNALMKLSS